MTQLFNNAASLVLLVVGLAVLVLAVFSLIEAVRFQSGVYPSAGKQSKKLWVVLTAVATALAFVSVFDPLRLGGILGAGLSIFFLVGVRPALTALQPRRRGGSSSGGPTSSW